MTFNSQLELGQTKTHASGPECFHSVGVGTLKSLFSGLASSSDAIKHQKMSLLKTLIMLKLKKF